MHNNPVAEHYALILLPLVMLFLCILMLARLRDLFLFVYIGFLAARALIFVCHMWRTNTVMSYIAPVLMFLAVQEILPAPRWRYWFAIGVGTLVAGTVWLGHGSPWLWRAAIYSGCCAALAASLLHSWLFAWGYGDPRGENLTKFALFVFCAAAAFSTHPDPGWWTATLVTEIVQIAALGLMLWGTYER